MHSTEKYSIKERQDIIKTLHLLNAFDLANKIKEDYEHMMTGRYGYSAPDTYHTIRLKDEIVLDVSFIEACKLDIKKELGKTPIVDVYFTDQMFEDYEFQIVIN